MGPMTLGRWQILEQIRILFYVAPHEMIFSVAIIDVLDKQSLLKLNHKHPIYDTPSPGCWKLTINDLEVDLSKWNPHGLNPATPILVVPNIDKSLGHITTTTRSGRQVTFTACSTLILVAANYAVAEIVKLVRATAVSGVFEEPNVDDLRKESRSVSELGWKDGTTLRLELW
ncbi:hypothetical protein B7494_g6866 [Chlorociboria aeruginascens]|nr:hypothetical protein B7494_g6866 [Chlorociboria aeruginascens]